MSKRRKTRLGQAINFSKKGEIGDRLSCTEFPYLHYNYTYFREKVKEIQLVRAHRNSRPPRAASLGRDIHRMPRRGLLLRSIEPAKPVAGLTA